MLTLTTNMRYKLSSRKNFRIKSSKIEYISTKLRLKKPPLQFYFISRMAQHHSCMLLPKEAIHLYQYCLALGQIYMQRMKRSVPLCILRQNMATKMFVMNLLNMELMYQVCKDSNAECSSNANKCSCIP